MTREEASRILESLKTATEFGAPVCIPKRYNEVFQMAIEALYEPQIVRCKDCKNAQWDEFLKCYWCQGNCRSADWFCAGGERKEA